MRSCHKRHWNSQFENLLTLKRASQQKCSLRIISKACDWWAGNSTEKTGCIFCIQIRFLFASFFPERVVGNFPGYCFRFFWILPFHTGVADHRTKPFGRLRKEKTCVSSVKIMKYVCSLLVIRRTHNTFIPVCKLSSHPSWKQTPFFLLLVYLRFTVWATLRNREEELATDITKSDDGKCGERRIIIDNEDWIPVEIRSKGRQVPENQSKPA